MFIQFHEAQTFAIACHKKRWQRHLAFADIPYYSKAGGIIHPSFRRHRTQFKNAPAFLPRLSMRNNAPVEHCVAEAFILHREIVLTMKAIFTLRAYLTTAVESIAR